MNLSSEARRRWLLTAACVGLFVAVRCLALTADPPRFVGEFSARELLVEPPAKSHEARNYALFGAFKVNPADSYSFWRAQSPAWVYPLAGYFTAFGVGYPQLRIFSTLYAAFGLAVLLLIAADLMRPAVWVFVGLLLALDPSYFHTARVGFLEPAVSSWIALGVLALMQAERDARWLCLAMVAFVLGFFTKQAAISAAPVFAVACVYGLWRAKGKPRWIVLGCALLLAASSAAYIASVDYMRTVAHNVHHVLEGEKFLTRHVYSGLGSLVGRALDAERLGHLVASVPISGPIALLCCAGYVVQVLRRRKLPSYGELVLLGWFVCSVGAMAVIARSGLRFWTLVVPPAALVAGLGIEHALRALEARMRPGALRLVPLALPLLALVVVSAQGYTHYFGELKYSVRDGALRLQAFIGPRDATIVGYPSAAVVLGTPYKHFYVRGRFNAKPDQLAKLGITHFLFRADRADGTRDIIERRFPKLMRGHEPVLTLVVRNEVLNLYDVDGEIERELNKMIERKKAKKKKRR